jgi:hypothetical protein
MSRGILGRGAIAQACSVAPKTVTSWHRSTWGRGPSLLRTHREYMRAIAILLYERFPTHRVETATLLRVTPRMVLEWRMQVRSRKYQSELIWATRLALVHFYPRIPQYFEIKEGNVILTQHKFPDSAELEQMVFAVYDRILEGIILNAGLAQVRRECRSMDKWMSGLGIPEVADIQPTLSVDVPRRINGAHSYRGAEFDEDGDVDFCNYYRARRKKYGEVPRNLMWLANSELLSISDLPLEVILESLKSPKVRNKRYKMRYGNLWVKWNILDVLMNYIMKVDFKFKTLN